jgi:hypothetical protein
MSSFIITLLLPIWYILSLFLFAGHFGLPTSIGGLFWGFARQGLVGAGRSVASVAGGSQGYRGAGGQRSPAGGSRGAGGQSGPAGGFQGTERQSGPIGGSQGAKC